MTDNDRIRLYVAQIAETEAGKHFFKWLMDECGFLKSSVVLAKNDDIASRSTEYLEGRRVLFLDIRKMIPVKDMIEIEFNHIPDRPEPKKQTESKPDEEQDQWQTKTPRPQPPGIPETEETLHSKRGRRKLKREL